MYCTPISPRASDIHTYRYVRVYKTHTVHIAYVESGTLDGDDKVTRSASPAIDPRRDPVTHALTLHVVTGQAAPTAVRSCDVIGRVI